MNKVDKSYKNNKDFYILFGLVSLCYILTINTDFAEFSQHDDINIPTFFFFYSLGVDVLVVISLVFIFLFRKIGIVLFPVFVLAHFGMHNYYLNTYLYSDITALFVFVFGLVAVIPRWGKFK